uniref:hypothetical protein n=1 Tax=Cupriavidus necator TaxID=106590 RepID=UPI003FA47608
MAARTHTQPGIGIPTPPYLVVRAHGPRDSRTVHLAGFAVPTLPAWSTGRATLPIKGELLFTLTPDGRPITDMSFCGIVSEILNAIGATEVEMSPRPPRNPFCRRQLLTGRPRDEVSQCSDLPAAGPSSAFLQPSINQRCSGTR